MIVAVLLFGILLKVRFDVMGNILSAFLPRVR